MNKTIKNILKLIIPGLLYLAISIPMRNVLSVFTVTDVRPSVAIVPLSSIWFGPLAALSCAIGNMISDITTKNPLNVILLGVIFQFVYGYVSWYLWKKLTKGDDHSYRFDSISKLLKFTLVIFIFAILSATGVGFLVTYNYGVPFFDTFKFVFLNNFDLPMIIGCPAMIIANIIISKKKNEPMRKLSINELAIIFSTLLILVGTIIIGYSIYASNSVNGTYDIWNVIYLRSALFVNIILILEIIFITLVEKAQIKKGNR